MACLVNSRAIHLLDSDISFVEAEFLGRISAKKAVKTQRAPPVKRQTGAEES